MNVREKTKGKFWGKLVDRSKKRLGYVIQKLGASGKIILEGLPH